MIEDGKYTPVIDRSFSLDQISEAFVYVDQGIKPGNVVILISPENQSLEVEKPRP